MILGITPARGGSKRLPRKNIREICGKPLIAWTIDAARASRLLDRYVVSTEDVEIAQISRQYGAEVIERPRELATDEATTLSALQHVLTLIPADTVVVLQATSPIRDSKLIDLSIEKYVESKADSLATGFLCKHTEYGTSHLRSQDIPGVFCDDGNVYIIRADQVRAGDRYGNHMERMFIDREQNVEIDDEFDFWVAEQILKRRQGLL